MQDFRLFACFPLSGWILITVTHLEKRTWRTDRQEHAGHLWHTQGVSSTAVSSPLPHHFWMTTEIWKRSLSFPQTPYLDSVLLSLSFTSGRMKDKLLGVMQADTGWAAERWKSKAFLSYKLNHFLAKNKKVLRKALLCSVWPLRKKTKAPYNLQSF